MFVLRTLCGGRKPSYLISLVTQSYKLYILNYGK